MSDGAPMPELAPDRVQRVDDRAAARSGVHACRAHVDHLALVHGEVAFGVDPGRDDPRGGQQGLGGRQVDHERRRPFRVQLAEDVVEQQHRVAADDRRDQPVPGEPQRERQRPLLALRRVTPGIEAVEGEPPVVAVRARPG